MTPARAPQSTSLNWTALVTAILLVAPFLRALWLAMQAAETTWLAANGDMLLFGAIIAAVLIGDSLRFGRPSRAFLLMLAFCLAAVGLASVVFAVGLQFDAAHARQLGDLTLAGPLLALACGCGARLCLKKAFPDDISR
jgi:hypothetical protein